MRELPTSLPQTQRKVAKLPESRLMVVGATGGIGRCVAAMAAARGAELILVARGATRLREMKQALVDGGRPESGVTTLVCDLRDRDACEAIAARTKDGVDFVVNAAGVGYLGKYSESEFAKVREMVESNILGACAVTHATLGALTRSGGHFVQIASALSQMPKSGAAAFAATQHGLRGLIHSLRQEHAGKGVRFSLVNVGGAGVNTAFWTRAQPKVSRREMMSPEAVASAVLGVLQAPEGTFIDELTLRTP